MDAKDRLCSTTSWTSWRRARLPAGAHRPAWCDDRHSSHPPDCRRPGHHLATASGWRRSSSWAPPGAPRRGAWERPPVHFGPERRLLARLEPDIADRALDLLDKRRAGPGGISGAIPSSPATGTRTSPDPMIVNAATLRQLRTMRRPGRGSGRLRATCAGRARGGVPVGTVAAAAWPPEGAPVELAPAGRCLAEGRSGRPAGSFGAVIESSSSSRYSRYPRSSWSSWSSRSSRSNRTASVRNTGWLTTIERRSAGFSTTTVLGSGAGSDIDHVRLDGPAVGGDLGIRGWHGRLGERIRRRCRHEPGRDEADSQDDRGGDAGGGDGKTLDHGKSPPVFRCDGRSLDRRPCGAVWAERGVPRNDAEGRWSHRAAASPERGWRRARPDRGRRREDRQGHRPRPHRGAIRHGRGVGRAGRARRSRVTVNTRSSCSTAGSRTSMAWRSCGCSGTRRPSAGADAEDGPGHAGPPRGRPRRRRRRLLLAKPFAFSELLARIRALTRRAPSAATSDSWLATSSSTPCASAFLGRRREPGPLGPRVRAAQLIRAPCGRGVDPTASTCSIRLGSGAGRLLERRRPVRRLPAQQARAFLGSSGGPQDGPRRRSVLPARGGRDMGPGRTGSDPGRGPAAPDAHPPRDRTLLVVTALVIAVGVTTLLTATTLMRQSIDRTLDRAVASSLALHDLFEGDLQRTRRGPLGDADRSCGSSRPMGGVSWAAPTTADLTGLPDQAALDAAAAGGDDRRDGTYGGADMRLLRPWCRTSSWRTTRERSPLPHLRHRRDQPDPPEPPRGATRHRHRHRQPARHPRGRHRRHARHHEPRAAPDSGSLPPRNGASWRQLRSESTTPTSHHPGVRGDP